MGQILPKPVESTVVERHGAKSFQTAVAELNGWRSNMEDAHLIITHDTWGFFGVFDGHGGDQCSKFVARELLERINANGCPEDDAAVKRLILDTDQKFLDTNLPSGSTGTMCIIHKPAEGHAKHRLRVINAGDSRVLLGRRDGSIVDGGGTDQGLTTDHKPNHPSERERIVRCGGFVQSDGPVPRVNGDLAVSRSFGDASYKTTGGPGPEDRPITADPELGHFECDDTDFVVLVCDGVSEGEFSNAEVIQMVAEKLRETNDLGIAATAICHKAVETHSKDNITCMIVLLEGGEGRELEFNPGPLTCAEHKNFLTAYTSMAEKAGTTLAKAAELRYELVEDMLSGAKVVTVGPQCTPETLEAEKTKIGEPHGERGSEERAEWFRNWAEERQADGDSGAASGGPVTMYQQMLLDFVQQGRASGPGPNRTNGPSQSQQDRPVRVAELDTLKKAVDAHPALKWDERMEDMAGSKAALLCDDQSDNTSQVRFEQLSIIAWLPTCALTDLTEQ